MPPRPRLSLDGQWQFWKDPDATLSTSSLITGHASPIAVPAPWQSQSPELRFYAGVAWYRRTVEIPADWFGDRAVILGFGAADYLAEVWLNNVRIGEHEGGYLPFEFDATGATRPGANTLAVRIADPTGLFPEIPHGKQSWYGPLSGLWQSVWVESRPAMHLVRTYVTPRDESVDVAVTLSRPLASEQSLTFEILSPDGQICARAESSSSNLSISVPHPLLWDIESPNLYTLRVTLHGQTQGSAPTDTLSDTFGFRTIETRDGQILLNGRPIYLRGALDQDYYPDLICTPPSLEYIEDEFRQAKAMGLNCLRVHIKVADPRYYAAADRVGLLIWTELPNWSYLTDAAIRRGRVTLEGMIQRDWNHPAIIIRTIINEAWGTELATNPDHRAWLAEMYAWVKSLDPTRLVVDNSPCFPNFHVRSDLDDFHFYAAMPDGASRWDGWVDDFATRPDWIYAPRSDPRPGPGDLQPNEKNEPPSPDRELRSGEGEGGEAPLLVSEFGNWGLPELGPLLAHYQGEPWWFETGWDRNGGVVYPHAAHRRFHDLHLDKVFGDYAGLARASQWMQFEALKYEIETMRLYPSIVGYVITEFTDVHWECNGLLDMLRRPKAYFDRLADLNADTMIIPRTPRRACWSGEEVTVELHLSHFGPAPIQNARLEWSWGGPTAPRTGVAEQGISVAPASVRSLDSLRLTAPQVRLPASSRLQLSLLDQAGAIIARNYLDFSVFPQGLAFSQPVACRDAGLAASLARLGFSVVSPHAASRAPLILTRLTVADRGVLEQGGQALFLAERPESLETTIPGLRLHLRENTSWAGDWASTFAWFRRDKFARAIPGDGRLDFTFASVLPETVISSAATRAFEHEVLAGLFVGWLREPAALIQTIPVGRGRLIVTTLRLKHHLGADPVATTLFSDLLGQLQQLAE